MAGSIPYYVTITAEGNTVAKARDNLAAGIREYAQGEPYTRGPMRVDVKGNKYDKAVVSTVLTFDHFIEPGGRWKPRFTNPNEPFTHGFTLPPEKAAA